MSNTRTSKTVVVSTQNYEDADDIDVNGDPISLDTSITDGKRGNTGVTLDGKYVKLYAETMPELYKLLGEHLEAIAKAEEDTK